MPPFSPLASTSDCATPGSENTPSRQTSELAYQAITIAAILLVLGSLWVF